MAPLFLSFTQTSSLSFLSLFLFSLQLLCLSQPSTFVAHGNASSASCPHHQKAALLQLKHGFSIYRCSYHYSSSRLDSWNQATDCCSWEDITCDVATGLMIELDLGGSYDSWIYGRINSSLFHIWSLQKLNLSFNDFYPNPIPSGLGQLTNLTHLNLSASGFVGQIRWEGMSQLTKLVSLDLSENGGLEIKISNVDPLFGNLSSLEELFLDEVNISEHGGEWARALSSTLPNLHRLSLRDCGFVGPIPLEGISQLTKLVFLDLSENGGLEIKISNVAPLFRNLSSLEELFLDEVNISEHGGEWDRALFSALPNLHKLSLRDCGFVGQIPLEGISQLTKLVFLDLSKNGGLEIKISNVYPLFGNLSSLEELFLDEVNISEHGGEWTRALFSALPKLHKLSLRDCGFVGQIPLQVISQLTKLVSLDLSENGGLEIKISNVDPLFGNSSSLIELFLDEVHILDHGGEWAHALSSAFPTLRILSLRSCGLSGPNNRSLFEIPFLSQLLLDGNNLSLNAVLNLLDRPSSLTSLTLSNCGLCGKFSKSVFLLPDLQTLDISYNLLLTIDFPKFPKNSALQFLIMGNTNIQEKLPDSIGNLKFLVELSLSNCNLSSLLPSSIANLIHLEVLVLSSNNFRGPIPSHLFSHPSLYHLNLGYNNFDSLPDDIQNASSSLTTFYLDGNKFQGPIPSIIYNLVEIQELDLSYNNFSGTIELLYMFQSFWNLRHLDLSHNNLSVINSMAGSNLISSTPIKSLGLSSCNMSEFPSILRNLNKLENLNLSNNKIHGKIPSWIWKVGNGTLNNMNLSHNFLESFEHPMPDLSFSQLNYIDLHSNRLQGSIPSMPPTVLFQDYSKNSFSSIVPHETNLTFVFYFFLSDNNISGEIPLSICKARDLQVLDLSSNKFSGRIPECLAEISDSLEILNLRKNSFHGMMPQSFRKACTLRTLNVQENQLEGSLPRSLANCKNLEVLDLGNNQINDTFPFWLKDLSQLRILILQSNKFHGPIAYSHMNYPLFPLLQIFDISSNDFLGLFPWNLFWNWKAMMGDALHLGLDDQIVRQQITHGLYYQDSVTLTMKGLDIEVVKILTAFVSIDLSNNNFEGRIEESIGNLKSLYVLNFSQNDFTGPIPLSLGNLSHLESLDLSRNKLLGEIPRQLLKLTFLAVLNLSQNLLNGSIPQGQQFWTFTNDSFLGNKGLCGPPLSTKCEDTRALSPSDFESFGSNKVGEIDWSMMWIGFGVGFGVGLGVVFWTLVLWKKGSRKYKQLIDGVISNFF